MAAVAVVAALVLSSPWLAGSSAAPLTVVDQEVRDRAARDGSARVIVELRLARGEHVPEGLLSLAARGVQRNEIASVRGQLLRRLVGRSHRVVRNYATLPFVALEAGADAIAELDAASFWVKRVFPDATHAPTLSESAPLIGADQAWSTGADGTGTVVAILDTGVDASHPFLAGKVIEQACYSSTVSGRSVSLCPNGADEQLGAGAGTYCAIGGCGHGTHVAGIAAGNGVDAAVTFSGVARGADIMAVQVFSHFTNTNDCGGGTSCLRAWTSDIIAGLERVYALRSVHRLAAANLSLGGGTYTAPCDGLPYKPIVDNLRSVGIATVVAAGNGSATNALSAPGCVSSAISVGATTKADQIGWFSNAAPFMSLFAPGVGITSSFPGGIFGGATGTSMATPHVTGAWAVLKQAAPSATVDQVLSALQTTGVPITDTRAGGSVTKPRIRVDHALSALVPAVVTVASVTPTSGPQGGTVGVTIAGSGFASGASVSAGPGIVVGNVSVTSSTLTATFTIAATATVGSRDVTVMNPGGASGTRAAAFTVIAAANPAPTLSTIVPNTAVAGGPGFTLTVNGAGFVTSSVVRWNGSNRPTTFVSGSQLQAAIPASDIGAAATAQVTVVTPSPGGGTSAQVPFTITSGSGGAVPGLAGYWRFDEGSGNVAGDSSGNGNNGALISGPAWTTGQVGGAITLNGTTQDVRVPDSPSLSVAGAGLTLATWIYPTAAQSGALIHKDYHYSIFRWADGSITYADSASWSYASIGAFGHTPLNTWSHVAVTFDGGAVRFYVNGQLVGTVARNATLLDNANPLYLGSYGGGYRFAGKLDETRVYGRALTSPEVAALSSGGGTPVNAPPMISSVSASPASILDSQTSQLSVIASDPDAAPSALGYTWSVPAGAGSLTNGNTATPTFTPAPVSSQRTVTLGVSVSDGAATTTGTVSVSVSPSTVSVPGLVGRWSFDEGSGGVAGDSSGNGNNGTLVNGPTWTTGRIGGAIELNGTTQEVRVPDSPSLSLTGTGLTLAAWIYPTTAQSGALLHKDYHYSIFRWADGSITYADSGSWSYASIGAHGHTPLNTWSHVAVTFDGSAVRFYVNGQLVGTVLRTATLSDNTSPLYIGSYVGAFRFTGRLDDAQVYTRALSSGEVSSLYTGGTSEAD